ncbi:MAG: T9SS type A sorting domain-containing protein [Bacteroidota bacterium]
MNKIYLLFLALCLFATTASAQLDNITGVTLAFTPTAGGATVEGTATDSGSGLAVDGPITLMESIDYNVVVTVRSGMNDITNQVQAAANDHQVFFQPMASFFNGDVDATDSDGNGLPVGLLNEVTTECTEDGDFSGMLRVKLADLDGMKSASSSIDDGTALFDLTWTITIEDDTTAPPCENEEEVITDVTLTFTPIDGGTPVVATAQDPDGEGPLNLTVQGDIELLESTEYRMTVELFNSINMEDITEEIRDEDDEHQFFFEFTDEIFLSPAGDGNVDNRDDPINYVDFDENMLPVGLTTDWTTECDEETSTGSFRVILKHQPGVKDGESTVNDGGTDIDITWTVNVNEDPDAPPCENEEEIITDVTLTFTPNDGGAPVVASAQDPDGEGPLDLTIMNSIDLLDEVTYTLTIELFNSIEMEDITEEIREEDDEHQFFFEFTEGIFSDPTGDGNADNRDDPINYVDFDENSLPVGLTTTWTAAEVVTTGDFRIVLKHQPGVKDGESTINDGGTDIDLTFDVNVLTSIEELEAQLAQQLVLVPNPATNQLNWRIDGQAISVNDPVDIRIISVTGQVINTYSSPGSRLDISRLPVGSYIFQLQTGQARVNKRFIKID